jgi:hypothetical protein
MNNEKAMMLTTKGCLIAFLNKLFGNTTPGSNLDCIALPRRLPCSNCLPRFSGTLVFEPLPLPSGPERLRPFSAPQPKPVTATPYPKNQQTTPCCASTSPWFSLVAIPAHGFDGLKVENLPSQAIWGDHPVHPIGPLLIIAERMLPPGHN